MQAFAMSTFRFATYHAATTLLAFVSTAVFHILPNLTQRNCVKDGEQHAQHDKQPAEVVVPIVRPLSRQNAGVSLHRLAGRRVLGGVGHARSHIGCVRCVQSCDLCSRI